MVYQFETGVGNPASPGPSKHPLIKPRLPVGDEKERLAPLRGQRSLNTKEPGLLFNHSGWTHHKDIGRGNGKENGAGPLKMRAGIRVMRAKSAAGQDLGKILVPDLGDKSGFFSGRLQDVQMGGFRSYAHAPGSALLRDHG